MHSSLLSIGCGFFLAAVCEKTIGVALLPLLTLLIVLDIVLVGVLVDVLLEMEVGVAGPSGNGPGPAVDVILVRVLVDVLLKKEVGAAGPSGEGPGLATDIILVGVLVDVLLEKEVGVVGRSGVFVGVLLDAPLEALVGVVAAPGGSEDPRSTLLLLLIEFEKGPKPPPRKSATEWHRRLETRENDDGVGVWLRLLVLLDRKEGRRRKTKLSSTLLSLRLRWRWWDDGSSASHDVVASPLLEILSSSSFPLLDSYGGPHPRKYHIHPFIIQM